MLVDTYSTDIHLLGQHPPCLAAVLTVQICSLVDLSGFGHVRKRPGEVQPVYGLAPVGIPETFD